MKYNSVSIQFAFPAGFALDLIGFYLYFVAVYLGYKLKKIIKIVIVTAILGIGCVLLAYFSPRGKENSPAAMRYSEAVLPSFILVLAWSLTNCCDNLGTGEFLTNILSDRISPGMFPPILFVVASTISFATGTSWGTMAILIPTAIPIAFALDEQTYGLTTMISLGAVLDGAIFGDHCSPISDTTIMSATASSCELMRHVRTQLPYGLLVEAIALIFGYVPSSLGLAPMLSLTLAILDIVILIIA